MPSRAEAAAIAIGALAWGVAKGAVFHAIFPHVPANPPTAAHVISTVLVGPAIEELGYRSGLQRVTGSIPIAAGAFALAHVDPSASAGWNTFKIADSFAGGVMYGGLFDRYGLGWAWTAHAAHNLGSLIGAWATGAHRRPTGC